MQKTNLTKSNIHRDLKKKKDFQQTGTRRDPPQSDKGQRQRLHS